MGMSASSGGGIKNEINITPLVDVVLVLLIIFMVITPLLQMGYEVKVPPKVESFVPPTSTDQIIVRLDSAGRVFINKQEVPEAEFAARFTEILRGHTQKLIFFAANGELPYERAVRFLDLCRDSGAENIGIVLEDLEPAP